MGKVMYIIACITLWTILSTLADDPTPGIPQYRIGCPKPKNDPVACAAVQAALLCDSDADCKANERCCVGDCGGRTCVVEKMRPGACPPEPKINCPAMGVFNCGEDRDCKKRKNKCCPTGCGGSECKAPARPPYVKLGCPLPPAPDRLNCPTTIPEDECTEDGHCSGQAKCCFNYCGFKKCIAAKQKRGDCPPIATVVCKNFIQHVLRCGIDGECAQRKKCCPTECEGTFCKPTCKDLPRWRGTVITEAQNCTKCSCEKLKSMGILLDIGCLNNDDGIRRGCCKSCGTYGTFGKK